MGPGRVSRTAAAACTSDVPVGGIRVVESIIREQNAEGWVDGSSVVDLQGFCFSIELFCIFGKVLGTLVPVYRGCAL